ncbi:MAG TPA: CBS domain-containing protein [Phycisphaerae bacterium]|nr:CBS domain-containing protein [Phycisphaerae bacterium]
MPIVRDVLNRKGVEVYTVSPETTVLDAARMMNERRCGAVCVSLNGSLEGMFTERDVLNRVVAQQLDPATTKVQDVMSNPVVTCGPEAKLIDCMAVMSSKKIRHLPVVDGKGSTSKLVGMISTGDLMAMDVAEKQAHIEHLHDYLHGRT